MTRKRLLWGAVIVLTFAVLSQVFPMYFYKFQLDDHIQQEVRYSAVRRKTPEAIRQSIADKAHDFNLPVKLEDVKLTKEGKQFRIDLKYTYVVDLYIYQHSKEFHFTATGEIF